MITTSAAGGGLGGISSPPPLSKVHNFTKLFKKDKVSINVLQNKAPMLGKSRKFCKGISRPGKSQKKC